jgi:phosphoribosylanthranilate isomerase
VQTVIVVNRPEDALDYPADLIQHYNDSADDTPSGRGAQGRIRSFRIKDETSLEELRSYVDAARGVHLDAYSSKVLGGSGHTFPWDLAVQAKGLTEHPIILAGGLTPENIVEALAGVRPYAVDLSSGVEASPGIKDHGKLKAFINAVRAWDLENE